MPNKPEPVVEEGFTPVSVMRIVGRVEYVIAKTVGGEVLRFRDYDAAVQAASELSEELNG